MLGMPTGEPNSNQQARPLIAPSSLYKIQWRVKANLWTIVDLGE